MPSVKHAMQMPMARPWPGHGHGHLACRPYRTPALLRRAARLPCHAVSHLRMPKNEVYGHVPSWNYPSRGDGHAPGLPTERPCARITPCRTPPRITPHAKERAYLRLPPLRCPPVSSIGIPLQQIVAIPCHGLPLRAPLPYPWPTSARASDSSRSQSKSRALPQEEGGHEHEQVTR